MGTLIPVPPFLFSSPHSFFARVIAPLIEQACRNLAPIKIGCSIALQIKVHLQTAPGRRRNKTEQYHQALPIVLTQPKNNGSRFHSLSNKRILSAELDSFIRMMGTCHLVRCWYLSFGPYVSSDISPKHALHFPFPVQIDISHQIN